MTIFMVLLAALIIFSYCFPFIYTISTSLRSQSEFLQNPVGLVKEIHFENYVEAWKRAKLSTLMGNSVFYSIVVTSLSVLMSIFLSYPVARQYIKGHNLIFVAFMIGMFLPDGSIPRWRMILKAGLYDTRVGYILTMVGAGGVMLMMFVSYIKNIPKELDEAAMIDGCGYIPFVFRILIPLMKPAIVSMALLTCINTWNEVMGSILFLTSEELFPLTRGLYLFKGKYMTEWPLLCAGLVIVAVPMLIIYIFLQRHIVDGIIAGGVKM